MTEAARILGLFSALLLVGSVAIWATMLRGPLLKRLDGRRASNVVPAELASQVLVFAFGMSALAVILAIAGWIFS